MAASKAKTAVVPFLQSKVAATAFDKAVFNATREVVALRIPVKRCAAFMKQLQGCHWGSVCLKVLLLGIAYMVLSVVVSA